MLGCGWRDGERLAGIKCLARPSFSSNPSASFSVAKSKGPEPQPTACLHSCHPAGWQEEVKGVSPLLQLGRGSSGGVWGGARLACGSGPREPKGRLP